MDYNASFFQSIRWEKLYPLVAGVTGLIVMAVLIFFDIITCSVLKGILARGVPNAISVASIGVGFLATIKSIAASASHLPGIKSLGAGYSKEFSKYLWDGIRLDFVVVLASAGLLLIDPTAPPSLTIWFLVPWTGIIVWAITTNYRVISLIPGILDR